MAEAKNKRGRPQKAPRGLISARLDLVTIARLYDRAAANGSTPSAEAASILTKTLGR